MKCGCNEDYLTTTLCPIHKEISQIITKPNPDWKKVQHLVWLGYRKNDQGTLPLKC